MPRSLSISAERFPIAGTFTISRGSKTEAEVVSCTVTQGDTVGRGECVPYRRYGETVASVLDAIEAMRSSIEHGMTGEDLNARMAAGAARNALDCALWDLEAKRTGNPVAGQISAKPLQRLQTAYTLSLGTPEAMRKQAAEHAWRPLLKIKVGGDGDIERIRAVREGAPASRIILDANEGWTKGNIEDNLAVAASLGVALVEQPLPEGEDGFLRDITRLIPICADESVHVAGDLERLVGLYDAINIKLDKAGGLTEALKLNRTARQLGFQIMVGCMVGTSLAMAPAVLLAQEAEFVDLDGPLLLARDRDPGLLYEGSLVSPPDPALWG